MNGRDFNNIGQDLNRIIDQAIRMGSYGNLNRNINDTLRRAFQGGKSNEWDFNLSKEQPKAAPYVPKKPHNMLFKARGKRRTAPMIMLIIGIIMAVSNFGLAAFMALGLLLSVTPGEIAAMIGTTCYFAVFFVIGIVLIVKGKNSLKLSGKLDNYIKCLQGNEFIDIKKLAAFTHQPESSIIKDIKKMFKKGWMPEGHLDQHEACLIVSNEAYEQYLLTVNNMKKRQEEEIKKTGLTPEAKAFIDKGHEYIRAIRKSNDEIPGVEMSNKMYHMELLVKKIFEYAEVHPESIPDLKKMINYYLPMTMKLFKSYEEFDKQPVQGENIINSKQEIEKTIDTLNSAYEKLLDDLFQDTAWDVSSDISVLKTMLAKEGLTGNDFEMK